MLDILSHLFAAVCGQNPSHTWAPGGVPLPCCQRCLGLYAGAAVAAGLHLWLRPKLTGRFLEIHGAFLVAMLPFGLHCVPQGPAVRTATGILYGLGVTTFLWLPLAVRAQGDHPPLPNSQRASRHYFLTVGLLLVLLPLTASWGGVVGAYLLACLAMLGAVSLCALALGVLGVGVIGTLRLLFHLVFHRVEA